MAYNKGLHSGGSTHHRGKPYVLILLITFGAALLGVMVLHKLRERRIYNLLVKEKDHQILALQLLLQKERDRTKELRVKNEDMKANLYFLRSQKMELTRTVSELQSTMDSMKEEQKVMESAFEEQQNALRIMERKASNVGGGASEIRALRENLKHREEEIKELQQHLENEIPVKNQPVSINGHPEIMAANGTMAVQDKTENENKEKDESSRESANEDATNRKSKKVKDGTVTAEIKDEIQGEKEPEKTTGEEFQDIDAEGVDGREKKAIREEKPGQLENNISDGGKDFNVKQVSGVKRKHGHAKGKRWRTIVKSRLGKNNGISENYGVVNMGNIKAYRDEKDELKGRTVGEVSNEEKFAGKDDERDKDNPRIDKSGDKLLKLENHERNYKNQQVTENGINTYPDKQRLDEIRQSEEQKGSRVQQNWSRRHGKNDNKNARQTKSNIFREEQAQSEDLEIQKQGKDAVDGGNEEDNDDDMTDFSRESQSEFEDEKEEYKEEIDESEFRPGL